MKSLKLLAALFALALLPGWGALNLGGGVEAAPAGGSGTDFTARSSFLGCWAMGSTDTQSVFENDNCQVDSSDDSMTMSGEFNTADDVPAGATYTKSLVGDGTADYMSLAYDSRFESLEFTLGCWYKKALGDSTNDYIFHNNHALAWGMKTSGSGAQTQFTVDNGGVEVTATAVTVGDWQHRVVRFSTSGAGDSTADTVEVFTFGEADCDSGCDTTSSDMDGGVDHVMTIMSQSSGGASKLTGNVVECFYTTDVLSDAEITELYLCGLEGTDNGTTKAAGYPGASCTIEGCC
jgi:hypothetical protein